ncbi:MAG: hypothetical protein ACPG49_06035 [Chitinophagales bacterium]
MKQLLIIALVFIIGFTTSCQSEGEGSQETIDVKTNAKTDKYTNENGEAVDLSGNTKEELDGLKRIVPNKTEIKEVEESYQKYKTAILESNGKNALESIDQNSTDHYKKLLDWALTGSKNEVESLDPVDMFMVLSIRQRIDKNELKKMNGKDLLIYTIENEWTNKGTVSKTELGDVQKRGENIARAPMSVNKANTNTFVEFTRVEKGAEWKMNLISLSQNVNEQLIRMAGDRDKSESELVIDMIKQITQSEVSEDIWNPIN